MPIAPQKENASQTLPFQPFHLLEDRKDYQGNFIAYAIALFKDLRKDLKLSAMSDWEQEKSSLQTLQKLKETYYQRFLQPPAPGCCPYMIGKESVLHAYQLLFPMRRDACSSIPSLSMMMQSNERTYLDVQGDLKPLLEILYPGRKFEACPSPSMDALANSFTFLL